MTILGVHIEGDAAHLALIEETGKKIEIKFLQSFSLQEPEELHKLIASLSQKKDLLVAGGLDGRDLIIRTLSLKVKSRRALLRVLPFQAQSSIPYPASDAILLPFFDEKKGALSRVKIIASTKELLFAHLKKLEVIKKEVDTLSCAPSAIARASHFFFPDVEALFFCHLGEKQSLAGTIVKGRVQESHSLSFGREDLEKEDLTRVQKELDRTLVALRQKTSFPTDTEIFLTGEGHALLAKCLPASMTILECDDKALQFALPLGFALDALKKDSSSVQFLQGIFTPQHVRKKRNKEMFTFLAACLLLSITTWGMGNVLLKQRESKLKERLGIYLNKPVSSMNSLEEELDGWEKKLTQKAALHYQVTVPKVSDILGWLSTHPLLSANKDQKETIDIKRVHYTLLKYPKIKSPTTPYQAQVQLEFTASSPKIARDFREALLKGDAIVRPKSEITWNIQDNTYQASFYL